jgi:hypothetical protein
MLTAISVAELSSKRLTKCKEWIQSSISVIENALCWMDPATMASKRRVLLVGILSCWRLVLSMFKCRLCAFTVCMFSMLAASGIFYHFLSQFRHRRLVACIKFSCALISVTQQREDDTSIYQKKKYHHFHCSPYHRVRPQIRKSEPAEVGSTGLRTVCILGICNTSVHH